MSVEVLSAVKNKITSFEEKWMQLEIITQSNQSRSPKGKHHSASTILYKWYIAWILYRFIESFMQIWQESGRETKDAEVVVWERWGQEGEKKGEVSSVCVLHMCKRALMGHSLCTMNPNRESGERTKRRQCWWGCREAEEKPYMRLCKSVQSLWATAWGSLTNSTRVIK